MIIRILNGCCGRKLNLAIMEEAMFRGKVLKASHPFVSFEVDEWTEFLRIYWNVCSDFSRDARGRLFLERMPVKVILLDGREFETQVWYDIESGGLRYVSLH